MIEVVEVQTEDERHGVFALRYAVYVEEMRRMQVHADHERRIVEEPEDQHARLLVARTASGTVVGTARVHLGSNIPAALETMYQLQQFAPFHPAQTSTTTKLMIDVRYRRSPLALRLAQACYNLGLAAGVSFNFVDCNAHLVPFFTRLGFRQIFPNFSHPDYGTVSPLVLALHDFDHFRTIGSPFALPERRDHHPSVAFFSRLLRVYSQKTSLR